MKQLFDTIIYDAYCFSEIRHGETVYKVAQITVSKIDMVSHKKQLTDSHRNSCFPIKRAYEHSIVSTKSGAENIDTKRLVRITCE